MSEGQVSVLSTGVRAVLKPVPAYMVDAMLGEIKEPRPPKQFIESKGREEENPFDPDYLDAIEEANHRRGLITLKAMMMFGVDLVDGIPDLDEWLPRLQWMAKNSNLDLSDYDLDDPLDLEFLYKSHIAVGNVDIMKITILSGMTNEEVVEAMRGFQSSQERDADREDGSQSPS